MFEVWVTLPYGAKVNVIGRYHVEYQRGEFQTKEEAVAEVSRLRAKYTHPMFSIWRRGARVTH